MTFDLWDPEGRGRIGLSLIRQREGMPLPDLSQQFKFVGAKTWAQFIVECNLKRMILKPGDWLVLTDKGWNRINSPDEVDDYVTCKTQGPLFVLDKMTKQNGKQVLVGHLFSANRTDMHEVELPAQVSPYPNLYTKDLPPPLRSEVAHEGRVFDEK